MLWVHKRSKLLHQAHVQEGTESTGASQQLRARPPWATRSLACKVWGEDQQEAALVIGHMAKLKVRKRAGPTNCGLSGWSVRKRRKAGAPFSQAGEFNRRQRRAGP